MLTNNFLGVEVVNEKEVGKRGVFLADQVKYIKTWKPKRNCSVPRFHLFAGSNYSVPLTLDTCKLLLSEYGLISVDTKFLVNPRQVREVVQKRFSRVATAKFDGAKSIEVPKNRIDLAMAKILPGISEELVFTAIKVDSSGFEMTDEVGSFSLIDLCYIDIFEFKSHYAVPRFHTTKGIYTVILTMNTCFDLFPNFIKMDSGLHVNFEYVDFVYETEFTLEVRFLDHTSVDIPAARRSMVSHLIRNDLALL